MASRSLVDCGRLVRGTAVLSELLGVPFGLVAWCAHTKPDTELIVQVRNLASFEGPRETSSSLTRSKHRAIGRLFFTAVGGARGQGGRGVPPAKVMVELCASERTARKPRLHPASAARAGNNNARRQISPESLGRPEPDDPAPTLPAHLFKWQLSPSASASASASACASAGLCLPLLSRFQTF